jgi:hypothetical protein
LRKTALFVGLVFRDHDEHKKRHTQNSFSGHATKKKRNMNQNTRLLLGYSARKRNRDLRDIPEYLENY